jgi:dipeptidyl-peptidase-4
MPESGGPPVEVTSLPGVHSPALSPDGTKLALLHSSDAVPPELYVIGAVGEAGERRITTSTPAEFQEYDWVEARYVTFPSGVDGTTIHGRLQEPVKLDRGKKYPAILGPVYSNTVRNQWPGLTGAFQQYLVERGYLVLQVDIRGSSGYGRKFREDLFLDYGGIDVEDLASGAAYLKSLPYVDPDRVGIWGWSYGGLLTTMSLFKKPGVYAAGVGGAPATNVWHALTGQTENLRRPDTHPDAYRKSSAASYGEELEDPLMIIHGLQDDVVLFKDSVTLAEKLMMLGKNFDFVILPSATHSYGLKDYVARFVLTKVAEHFDRHLGPGPR